MSDNDLKRRIDSIVDGMRDEIVGALSNILKYQTVSGAADEDGQAVYRDETARCLDWLGTTCRRMGFDWKNHENIYAYADLPAGESHVGLPVHIDVVPPGDGWTHDPFGGDVDQATVWGRGCQDDKGPAIQMLYAMHVLKTLNRPLGRGARLIVGTAEECGDWDDIKLYLANEQHPQISIVSDASFPIINAEKGMMNYAVTTDLDFAADPEPGGYTFKSAWAGERANIVPPNALLTLRGDATSDKETLKKELDRFIEKNPEASAEILPSADEDATEHDIAILFHGRGAHGSTPAEGHNAALDMLKFMNETSFVSEDESELAGFLHDKGASLDGAELDVAETHPFVGSTTVNLGIVHWLGWQCRAVFNIRVTKKDQEPADVTLRQNIARVAAVVSEFADETGFPVEHGTDGKTMGPIYVDPAQHPDFIDALKDAYTTFTGREATLHAIGGTTYAKVFPSAVCFGPVDPKEEPELAHQADERVRIEHLLRNVKIYAYALARLCAV